MGLPVAEARVLTRIEEGLISRDPRFRSLFAIFTRLTWQEAMPAREQLERRQRRPRPGAVILAALVLAVVGIVVAAFTVPARGCSSGQRYEGLASAIVSSCGHSSSSAPTAP
jgi:hypothetical protein